MGEKESLPQPIYSALQSTQKEAWTTPEVIVIPVPNTLNNDAGGGDGDSALATDS